MAVKEDISFCGFCCAAGIPESLCKTKGTITLRKDAASGNVQENFTYDNMRLKNYGSSSVNYTTNYSAMGNITFKTDAGNLAYGNSARPYQITEQTNFPSTTDTDTRTITYTSAERPATITKSGKTATFSYNHAGVRTKMEVKTGTTVNYTRIYLGGNYERETEGATTTERLYLGGTPYDAPAVAIRTNNGSWAINYIHRDYLGSIVAVSNASGTVVESNSYDAWGFRMERSGIIFDFLIPFFVILAHNKNPHVRDMGAYVQSN